MRKRRNKKKVNTIIVIIGIILVIAFIASITYILLYFYNFNKDEEQNQDLVRDFTTEEISKVNSEFVEKIKELQQENSDVKGWIRIDGTKINYPLVQTTDNDYYLTHNYIKENSDYGSIFLNRISNLKDISSNVIIYGHNMDDGQMFGELLKYENKDFYDEHSIIRIITEESEAEYKIIYAFKSRIFYKDEIDVFRYYRYYNFSNENKYNEYLNNCKELELYDTKVTAKYGEQLITLISCEYSQDNGRIVVVAKKI